MKAYTLNGMIRGQDAQLFFSAGERATAMAIAKEWLAKGYRPFLYEAQYDGRFRVLVNFRNAEKKAKKAA